MEKNLTLQSVLVHLAEEAALPSEINLWPSIQVHLAARKPTSQHRGPIMNTHFVKNKRYTVFVLVSLALLLALGVLLGLPQGRAWAQSLLRFFTRSQDRVALPTPQLVNLVGVTPGVANPTSTPEAEWHMLFTGTCGDFLDAHCSVEQIRGMVNFPVKGLSTLPEGFELIGATGGPENVVLVYQRNQPYTSILLYQGPLTGNEQPIPVGESAAIEPVQIGSLTGEYVKGAYFSDAGDLAATWDPSWDSQLLRWEDQGYVYTLDVMGTPESKDFQLDKTDLVELAAGLTEGPIPMADKPTPEAPRSLSEVEEEAGFQVVEPSWLPEGYQFKRATYLPDRKIICLEYQHTNDGPIWNPETSSSAVQPSLGIAESVGEPQPGLNELFPVDPKFGQYMKQEKVTVGGAQNGTGVYAFGNLGASKICSSANQNQVLQVTTGKLNLSIFARNQMWWASRNWLTQQEMVRLAESITGVHTIAGGQLDPDFLTSLEDAQTMVSFPLKYPTRLPNGVNFYFAQVVLDGTTERATINYTDGNYLFSINQTKGSQDTLEAIYQKDPETYHQVSIHQQPALLRQGYWIESGWKDMSHGMDGSAEVTWFEGEIKYTIGGFNAYPQQTWLDIAESVR